MKVDRRLALGIGLLILVFAMGSLSLWGYYYHSPSARLLKSLKQQAGEGQKQLQNLINEEMPEKKQYVTKLAEVDLSFQKINQLSDELEQMFPKEEKTGELLDLLSRAIESDGTRVLRIKPGEPQDQGSWWEIPVELEFECDLTELPNCLVSIERMPRFVRINSFSIALQEDDPARLEAEMVCSGFIWKKGDRKNES
jgi:Tfp pilus assembly protein PilO